MCKKRKKVDAAERFISRSTPTLSLPLIIIRYPLPPNCHSQFGFLQATHLSLSNLIPFRSYHPCRRSIDLYLLVCFTLPAAILFFSYLSPSSPSFSPLFLSFAFFCVYFTHHIFRRSSFGSLRCQTLCLLSLFLTSKCV